MADPDGGYASYKALPTATPDPGTAKPTVEKKRGPWARFAALWVLCCMASGVLPGQALFVELFANAGILSSICPASSNSTTGGSNATDTTNDTSNSDTRILHIDTDTDKNHDLVSIASRRLGSDVEPCKEAYTAIIGIFQTGAFMAPMLLAPLGLFFDRWGARAVGTAGAGLCAVGLLLIAAACQGAAEGYDAQTSVFFVLGVLASDFGAMMNSFSFMGLIWHFPGRQALILSLINCTYQVSAVLPFILEQIMRASGTSLQLAMWVYASTVLSSLYVVWCLVPSQAEFFAEAKRVLGMPLPRAPKKIEPCRMAARAWAVLRQDTCDHIWSGAAIAIGFGFPSFYASFTAPYGTALFGSQDDGDRLAQLYVSLTAIVGAAFSPFVGSLADCFGLHAFVVLLGVLLLIGTAAVGEANWLLQGVASTCSVLFSSLFNLFISRYLLQYSPPNRFGMVQGLYTVLVILAALPLFGTATVGATISPEGLEAYRVPLWGLGASGALALFLYSCYYRAHPPPDVPTLLPDDEAEVSKGFGCGTLQEVMEVVHIDDKMQLIRMLASTDPEVLHDLLRRIDTTKMIEKMAQRSLDDLADMMEDGAGEEDDDDDEELRANGDQDKAAGNGGSRPDEEQPSSGAEPLVEAPRDDKRERAAGTDNAEEVRIRALADELGQMVTTGDRQGVSEYLLKRPIADMMAVDDFWENAKSDAERKQMEKAFTKLLPGKEFAKLLRQRPELRTYVQQTMKKQFDRKVASMKRKR